LLNGPASAKNLIFTKITKTAIMATTRITVLSNGSLKVEGDFEIVDKEGNIYNLQGRQVVSLCRCGRSQNKPFCDASHKGHFEHEARAFDLPPRKV
jgi:CDGSH-type Zn-finger protein